MTTYTMTIAPSFISTLEELASPKYPRGYNPSIHDQLDPIDAACDIADSLVGPAFDESMIDMVTVNIAEQIRMFRAARQF